MLTCYFDFLTTPIITLLVGTITLILLNNKKELKTNIKILIKTSIFWGLGYGLMWILKWAIADFMYNKDTFATAMYQLIFRTSSYEYNGENISIFEMIMNNILWAIKY